MKFKGLSFRQYLMQRCASHIASDTDIKEAGMLGMKALQCALEGRNGIMASIQRTGSKPYRVIYSSVPIEKVTNHEKKVPKEMIHENGCDIIDKMIEYLLPLIQGEVNIRYEKGIPKHVNIKS
ncbi:hypothetical protein KQI61_08800 [Anaerocolumna aminovalerica]|uniref:hypothetical protein n=1 Tax=Anaerocolumna aminovalerica TaxID=1527 RepID=UPI001C0F060D|nr:hypothetical protein [Anaerocolumna aminovalerica]MBU5332297.1 hypothetical protein [Anaerocolumna aminovalerica]